MHGRAINMYTTVVVVVVVVVVAVADVMDMK